MPRGARRLRRRDARRRRRASAWRTRRFPGPRRSGLPGDARLAAGASPESRVSNPVPSPESRVLSPESRIPNPGHDHEPRTHRQGAPSSPARAAAWASPAPRRSPRKAAA
ncbi:MAG: hypothetical protein MZV64_13920 [Ignavibacteriales bacterium]|nr:hypothetical protein [Ignavibacteriales bacterium]